MFGNETFILTRNNKNTGTYFFLNEIYNTDQQIIWLITYFPAEWKISSNPILRSCAILKLIQKWFMAAPSFYISDHI